MVSLWLGTQRGRQAAVTDSGRVVTAALRFKKPLQESRAFPWIGADQPHSMDGLAPISAILFEEDQEKTTYDVKSRRRTSWRSCNWQSSDGRRGVATPPRIPSPARIRLTSFISCAPVTDSGSTRPTQRVAPNSSRLLLERADVDIVDIHGVDGKKPTLERESAE